MALKEVWAPHLNRNVKVGGCKLPPPDHKPMLRLKNYLTVIPTSPSSVAYASDAAMKVIRDLEGNDAFGDCVEAEEAHYVAIVTGAAGKLFSYTTEMTEKLYTALTGFNRNDPKTDTGTDPIECLSYCLAHPYEDKSVNLGYLQVDATNPAEIQYAINTFGNLKIWLPLPDSFIKPFPSKDGFVWDADEPNPENGGHCVGSCGYIAKGPPPQSFQVLGVVSTGIVIVTWGLIGILTFAGAAKLCRSAVGGGMAVRVTPDWLDANGETPTGLSINQIVEDFIAIGGIATIPKPPTVPPSPAPAPGPNNPFQSLLSDIEKILNNWFSKNPPNKTPAIGGLLAELGEVIVKYHRTL